MLTEVAPTSAYEISAKELSDLVSSSSEKPELLETVHGGAKGIARKIHCDPSVGLSGDANDIAGRQAYYGRNFVEGKKAATFLELCWDALQDFTLIMLMCCAALSMILGVVFEENPTNALIEGGAIFVSVVVVVGVTATNDYFKEKQFRALSAQASDIQCDVLRGGKDVKCSIKELVVGDIVYVQYGDVLPADGLLLQCSDVMVDESSLTGEPILIKKSLDKKPYLLSGTKIMEGSGRMMVVAVGDKSQSGIIKSLVDGSGGKLLKGTCSVLSGSPNVTYNPAPGEDLLNEIKPGGEVKVGDTKVKLAKKAPFTPTLLVLSKPWSGGNLSNIPLTIIEDEEDDDVSVLAKKLENLAMNIGYCGTFVAVVCVIVMIGRFLDDVVAKNNWNWEGKYNTEILHFIITGITILVVAVPEGLPLAVTLALAFSTRKMLSDNNLVKHLDACETMGSATTICSDKTGTLTTNRMTVMKCFVGNKEYDRCPTSLKGPLLDLVVQGIALNSGPTSRVEKDPKGGPLIYNGNKTECALLAMLLGMDHDADYIRKQPQFKYPTGEKAFPFNSARKRMSFVHSIGSGKRRILTKGASEVILSLCTTYMTDTGASAPLSEARKVELENTIINAYANDGLRTLCLAYRDLDDDVDLNGQNVLDEIEANMTMVLIVGIEDPVRPEVPSSIAKCNKAGISVRMVTGDNINTALAIAHKCGILPKDQREHFIAMEGPDFRNLVTDADGNIKQDEFDKIWPRLRVLARSQPKDKYTLVTGLINSNLHFKKLDNTLNKIDGMYVTNDKQVIAVTGDGTNDAPALSKADVGFAMGILGTQVAKDACDIILLDDNFSSIVKACMWGRNVYDSISKFLQFQLTVNFAAIFMASMGAIAMKDSPLKAVQMLWVNLIMDSLASLALATETPTEKLLDRDPYGRNEAIISSKMTKHIILMGIYQIAVLCIIVFYFDEWLGIECGRPEKWCVGAIQRDYTKIASVHYTMVFHTFVMMTLFNEINSRRIHDEINVFENMHKQYTFIAVMVSTMIGQFIMVEFVGPGIKCVPLDAAQFFICVAIGLSVFPVRFLIRWVPDKLFFSFGAVKQKRDKTVEGDEITRDKSILGAKAATRLDKNDGFFQTRNKDQPKK